MAKTVLEQLAEEIGADANDLGYHLYRKGIPDHRKPVAGQIDWMERIFFPARRRADDAERAARAKFEPEPAAQPRVEPTQAMAEAGAFCIVNCDSYVPAVMAQRIYKAMEDARLGEGAAPASPERDPGLKKAELVGTYRLHVEAALAQVGGPCSAVVVNVAPGKFMDVAAIEHLAAEDGTGDGHVIITLRDRAEPAGAPGVGAEETRRWSRAYATVERGASAHRFAQIINGMARPDAKFVVQVGPSMFTEVSGLNFVEPFGNEPTGVVIALLRESGADAAPAAPDQSDSAADEIRHGGRPAKGRFRLWSP